MVIVVRVVSAVLVNDCLSHPQHYHERYQGAPGRHVAPGAYQLRLRGGKSLLDSVTCV
jgi:hypothetical protein